MCIFNFLLVSSRFAHFEAKHARQRLKNPFKKPVLEVYFASISGMGGSILSKQVKIVVP
jgi:hypothetical protein